MRSKSEISTEEELKLEDEEEREATFSGGEDGEGVKKEVLNEAGVKAEKARDTLAMLNARVCGLRLNGDDALTISGS